jgi:hypothetical protein
LLSSAGGKLTEWLTLFALKGGNLMRRIGINWFVSGNTALEAAHGTRYMEIHGKMVHLIFASFQLQGAERASRMAYPEQYANRSRMFFYVEW